MFATGTDRCPIKYYKIFESHRPKESKRPSSPFFLAVNHKVWRGNATWYKVCPLGKNQIGKFLPDAAKSAGLEACGKKVANHSVRKTSISHLLDAGIPENFVTQLSGHKNLQSLSTYKSASLTQQRQMSDCLRQDLQHVMPPPIVPGDGRSSTNLYSNQSTMSVNQSSFSLQGVQARMPSLFASANIGSISNCVFNIQQPVASHSYYSAAPSTSREDTTKH